MCFSAPASFAAGIALTLTGVFTVKKISERNQIPMALVPLIFGVQQIAEGFVWLGLQKSAYAPFELNAVYTFLFFAQVLWPVWVPFSLFFMEKEKRARRVLFFLLVFGIIASVFLCNRLVKGVVSADCEGMHVNYSFSDDNAPVNLISLLYFQAIVASPFVSTFKNMKWVGLLAAASFLVAFLFYSVFLISVWCFFAAIISASLYCIMGNEKKWAISRAFHRYKR